MSSQRNCKNCLEELHGKFCHNCGQPIIDNPWTTKSLFKQFIQLISNIEKGFLFTSIELFKNPSKVVSDYWFGITIKYYSPFRYVLFWVAINLIINISLGIDDILQESLQPDVVEESFSKKEIESADQKLDKWLNALVLILIPFFSMLTKIFFKKSLKNYAEHLILNSYVIGQHSLISSFSQIIFYLIPSLFSIYMIFNFIIGVLYNTYIYKALFKDSWLKTLGKSFLISLLGVLLFFGIIALFSMIALKLN